MIQPPPHAASEADLLMIVEDDARVAASLDRVLSGEGYDTTLACDGKAALEILQRSAVVPSVILLDLIMPRMGGLELVERLERDNTFSGIPIILMSGHAPLTRGNRHPGVYFLPKPFQHEELLGLVRDVGRQSSSRWMTSGSNRMRAQDQR